MSEPIKPRIDFEQSIKEPEQPVLRAGQAFDGVQAERFLPVSSEAEIEQQEGEAEAVINRALKPRRSLWGKMVRLGAAVFGVSVIAQGVEWVHTAWVQQDWVSLGACTAGGLIVVAGVGSLLTEWRRLYRLRQRADERDVARDLLHSHGLGQGRAFCEKLAGQAGMDKSHPALQRWQASLHETQNDREVVELYARLVQPVLDAQARREISNSAAESALMIAVSPLALVDMAFIAWRNLRLVNRIAVLYGIELGYFSRLRLFRLVLALKGHRLQDGAPLTVFPGEVPARLPGAAFWQQQGFHFDEFRPRETSVDAPLPHIRLDAVMEFLLGDKMR